MTAPGPLEHDEVWAFESIAFGAGDHPPPYSAGIAYDGVSVQFLSCDRLIVYLLRNHQIVRSFTFEIRLQNYDFHTLWQESEEAEESEDED